MTYLNKSPLDQFTIRDLLRAAYDIAQTMKFELSEAAPLTDECPQSLEMDLVELDAGVELVVSVQRRGESWLVLRTNGSMDCQQCYSHEHFVCDFAIRLLHRLAEMFECFLLRLKLE